MGAAIWSTSHKDTERFPVKSFLLFWNNHCLLQLFNRPKWRTIKNGSQSYIDAILQKTNLKYFTSHPIQSIERDANGVKIYSSNGPVEFDAIVIATHADQALKMLRSPTSLESDLLGKWQYSKNPTSLHSDISLMPPKRSAWSSWMYSKKDDGVMTASYYMNRLQSLPNTTDYFVSLNDNNSIDQSKTIYKTIYEHPMMTRASMETQNKLHQLQGVNHTFYCGSYFGFGFHEDGFKSALNVGELLNCKL